MDIWLLDNYGALPPFIFQIKFYLLSWEDDMESRKLWLQVTQEARQVYFSKNTFEVNGRYLKLFWRFCLEWGTNDVVQNLSVVVDKLDYPFEIEENIADANVKLVTSCSELYNVFLFNNLVKLDVVVVDHESWEWEYMNRGEWFESALHGVWCFINRMTCNTKTIVRLLRRSSRTTETSVEDLEMDYTELLDPKLFDELQALRKGKISKRIKTRVLRTHPLPS
ncbi:hypothetical protein MMC13_004354 [Lambiella insularis]|nr:hypothetical protein [Lambiella insularis]